MGIYDRDYYRREGPSYLGSLAVQGQICRWLLAINVAVFVLQLLGRQMHIPVTQWLWLSPGDVLHGEVWRLLTHAFLHDPTTWVHIVFNMWMLWLYGSYLEDLYGRWEFLAFYLTAALISGLAYLGQAVLGWGGLTMNTPALGASGAIMGLMVLCTFHYPHLTILLFFVLPMPLWAMTLLFVSKDLYGFLSGSSEQIAFAGHLGGALFAAVYYKLHWRLLSFWPSLRSWKLHRSRPRLRVFQPDDESRHPVPVPDSGPSDIDEHLEAKVDAVLAKVARFGQDSLSESEKQVLLKASEIYKKRRS